MFLSKLLEMAIDLTSGNYGTYAEVMDRFHKLVQMTPANASIGCCRQLSHD